MKNPDWNSAFINNQDWKAVMSSEVFRNYYKAELDKAEEEEKEQASAVPQPLMRNRDYMVEAQNKEISDLLALAEAEAGGDIDIDDAMLTELDNELDEAEAVAGASNFELNDGNPYDTSAGESKFIDIGLTTETIRELDEGINYADDDPYLKLKETPNITGNVEEVMSVYNKAASNELYKAEKALGLNLNMAYQLSKLRK
jgi:hypothetical protein